MEYNKITFNEMRQKLIDKGISTFEFVAYFDSKYAWTICTPYEFKVYINMLDTYTNDILNDEYLVIDFEIKDDDFTSTTCGDTVDDFINALRFFGIDCFLFNPDSDSLLEQLNILNKHGFKIIGINSIQRQVHYSDEPYETISGILIECPKYKGC